MTETDLQRVSEIVAELDRTVSREGAKVQLKQYGGGPDESKIIATRLGYLRLGVEFLKAAFARCKSEKDPDAIDVDLKYLLTDDSTVGFDWFERRENIPISEEKKSWRRKVGSIVLVALFVSMFVGGIILAIIGGGTVFLWIVGK